MTIFRKLFATYLMVVVLALVVSGGFAGYMVWKAAGETQFHQMETYGQQLAAMLQDQPWDGPGLAEFQSTAEFLDRGGTAHIWLLDASGLVQFASSGVKADVGQRKPVERRFSFPGRPGVAWTQPHPTAFGPSALVPVIENGEAVGTVVLRPGFSRVRQARNTITRFIAVGSLVAALLLGIVSFILSQRLARPVEKVSAAVRQVARGDFSSRVDWRSEDEVGRLAEAFNHMAGQLELLESNRKELMATVSHELKGPLARVAGYLEAIEDGLGGQAAREQHFAIVKREVGRLTRLVNDLLDYSRLEVGKLRLHPFPCDLAPCLVRAAQVFAPAAEAQGVVLEIRVPQSLPIVEAEPERIEQVVANLLENALSFTSRGGQVTLVAGEADGALEVTVADTGPGIPPDELERIFERFYKQDQARTPGRRGFGLGLTIVRQLVELHGGSVMAESEPGKGSVFGFRLPLAREA